MFSTNYSAGIYIVTIILVLNHKVIVESLNGAWCESKIVPMTELVEAISAELIRVIVPEIKRVAPVLIEPAPLTVKQPAEYLGRSEQAIQHLIFLKALPVVKYGRRVHLHRADLDLWIERNKY